MTTLTTLTNRPAPFRIKVCGIRRGVELRACAAIGVDAIGLNLYQRSVRYVDPDAATTLALADAAADLGLRRIGVFVNESVESMHAIATRLTLDGIQLHGDETVETAMRLIDLGHPVIRAIRLPTGPLTADVVGQRVGRWGDCPVTLMFDADAGSSFGGGGKTLDWHFPAREPGWVLAGGLTPENIIEAIRTSGAVAVDVASGVEAPRGMKAVDLIHHFARQAQLAWQLS